jgi:hypothetical protein
MIMRIKGTYSVLLVLTVLLIFSGCDTSGGGGPLYVVAAVELDDSGAASAVVMIQEGGSSGSLVADATVSINGTELNWFFFYLGSGLAISAGDNVTLDIQWGGSSISATLQMPEVKPTITAPVGGSASEPVDVSWTWAPGTDPDQFTITVEDTYTISADGYSASELGSARGHSIQAGTFDTSLSEAYIEVSAIKRTTSLGADAAVGSEFYVGNTDQSPPFNPEP